MNKTSKTSIEVIKFSIAGCVVLVTDFSVYYFLAHFFAFSVSKGISFTIAGIIGYLLNKYWIFKHNKQSYAEIYRYLLINFLALGVNVSTNQFILNIWPRPIWIALIIATFLTSFLTFVCFKWWVFRA